MPELGNISVYFFSIYTMLVISFSFLAGRITEKFLSGPPGKKKVMDYNKAKGIDSKVDLRDFSTNLPKYRPYVLESEKWRAESDTGLLYSMRRERFVTIPNEFVDLVRFLERKGDM